MATEKRLIDANALDALEDLDYDYAPVRDGCAWYRAADVWACIESQPTVDAVPVVRCKDCTNFERKFPGYGYCYHWDYEPGMSPNEVEDNDFCSYGERRTNDRKAD